MYKSVLTFFAFCLLSVILSSGCVPTQQIKQTPASPTETPTPLPPSVFTKPMEASWELGAESVATKGNVSVAIHFVVISDRQITVIYSFSGDSRLKTNHSDKVVLTDNLNASYKKLSSAQILADLGDVAVASVTFEGAQRGANRLALRLEPTKNTAPVELVVAQINPPNAQPEHVEGRQSSMGRNGYLDQNGYRISFNGFFPFTKDVVSIQQSAKGMTREEALQASATQAARATIDPGPIPPNPQTIELAGGKPYIAEATLRIEEISTRQERYLYMVVLEDGTVNGTWLK